MKMKYADMFMKLRETWPNLRLISKSVAGNTQLMDDEYEVPDASEIDKILFWRPWWKVWVLPPFCPERRDCDDFALLAYEIKQAYRGKGVLPFGIAGGDKFEYIKSIGPHALNILMCQDGPWLYDHQVKKYWKADGVKDSVWFVMI